jgi:hypothetical protein
MLVAIMAVLLTAPLLPALRELRDKADAAPLHVIQQNAGEVRHFADSFRAYLKGLEQDLQQSTASGLTAIGTLPDGTAYMVLTSSDVHFPSDNDVCPVLLAACDDLPVPSGITFSKDILCAWRLFRRRKQPLPRHFERKKSASWIVQSRDALAARG